MELKRVMYELAENKLSYTQKLNREDVVRTYCKVK